MTLTAWQVTCWSGWYLLGVIWTTQLVLYPMFRYVPPTAWASFHAQHTRRMGWAVAPAMVIELGATLVWVFDGAYSLPLRLLCLGLVLLNWQITFFGAVPLHRDLARAYHRPHVEHLIRVNRTRTAAWTLKALVLAALWVGW